MADYGNYFVVTLHKTKTTGKQKKKRKKKKKSRNTTTSILCNTFSKEKGIQVRFQKSNEVANSISSQIPIFIEPLTLMQNVMSSFNWMSTTQTAKFLPREELKAIFSYWSIISNSSYGSHLQRVEMSKIFDSQSFFDVQRFNGIEIVIQKIKKVYTLQVRYLEVHTLIPSNAITFIFLVKVP